MNLQNFIYKSRSEFDLTLGDPYNPKVLGFSLRPLSYHVATGPPTGPGRLPFLGGSHLYHIS